MNIYDPNDFPFGILSNHALYDTIINGEHWGTVTNFVLSNFMITPTYKLILKNTPIKGSQKNTNIENKISQIIQNIRDKKGYVSQEDQERIIERVKRESSIDKLDIYGIFKYHMKEEYDTILRSSLEKAYNEKANNDPEFREKLRKTGNQPIVYESENPKMKEYLPIILMQIRKNIREEKKEIDYEKKLKIYRAIKLLENEVDKLNDLNEYIEMNVDEIIEHYINKYKNRYILERYNNIEDIYEEYIREEYEEPRKIVKKIRDKNLEKIYEGREELRKRIITTRYVEFVIGEQYPNMQKQDIKKAAGELVYACKTYDDYQKINERILALYTKGNLPKKLLENLKEELKSITEIEKTNDNKKNFPVKTNSSDEESEKEERKNKENDLIGRLLENKTDEQTKKWKIFIKQKNGSLEFYRETKNYPYRKNIMNIVEEYNKKNNKNITPNDIFVKEKIEKKMEEKFDKKDSITTKKPIGNKIYLSSNIGNNSMDNEEYQELLPTYQKIFKIENLEFPTIAHYVGAMLLTLTGIRINLKEDTYHSRGISLIEATNILKNKNKRERKVSLLDTKKEDYEKNDEEFVEIEEIPKIYKRRMNETKRELFEYFSGVAITKKFVDVGLMKILALTGKNELFWNESKDKILGYDIKSQRGENLVGKKLMEIRRRIPEFIKKGQNITSSNIKNLLTNDEFIKKWLNNKLIDLSTIVFRFKKYMEEIGKQKQDIDPEFVQKILRIIYKNCTLFQNTEIKDDDVPESFIDDVKQYQKGLKFSFSKDYDKEIKELKEQLTRNELFLYGIVVDEKNVENPEDLVFSTEEYAKKLNEKSLEIYKQKIDEKYQDDRQREFIYNELKKYLNGDIFEIRLKERILQIKFLSQQAIDNYQKNVLDKIFFSDPAKKTKVFRKSKWELFMIELNSSKYSDKDIDKLSKEKREKYETYSKDKLESEVLKKLKTYYKSFERKFIEEILEKEFEKDDIDDSSFIKKRRKEIQEKIIEDIRLQVDIDRNEAKNMYKKYKFFLENGYKNFEDPFEIKVRQEFDKINSSKNSLISWLINIYQKELLNTPKYDIIEKQELINKFKNDQEKKKKEPSLSSEKIKDILNSNKYIKDELIRINNYKYDEIQSFKKIIKQISKIYWSHLTSIINYIVSNLKNPSENDIKKALIAIDLVLKTRSPNCSNIINLQDSIENCVVSALTNILIKIKNFKHLYIDEERLPFGNHDIDFASFILLGKGSIDREDPINFDDFFDDNNIEDIDNSDENEDGDVNVDDDVDEKEFDYGDADGNDSAEFGMKDPVNDREKIRSILNSILQINVSDKHLDYFMNTVDKIVEFDSKIKMARINFFATLK